MLREARSRLDACHVQGEADHLPLRDATFDFVAMGYALRHVQSLEGAFAQYYRILRPGGTVLLLEVTKPNNRLGLALMKFYFRDVVPLLTKLLTRSRAAGDMMLYHWETIDQMVPPDQVLRALEAVGFTDVRCHVAIRVFSEYTAKKPG